MKIEDINIFRVREIEHLKLSFGDRRLVAVLGENGSGKTTLLGCIIFLLCGEVIFKGGKDRMVRDVGGGDSWIAGTISHGEHKFKLKRFVSASTCEMVYLSKSNSKPIKTPTKVQAELDAMGLTAAKVMRTLLEQGKYGGMFHSTDGDRLRLMFEIFGLTDIDDIQEAIGAEASLIPIDVTIDDRWTAAQARLKAADASLHDATVAKAAVSSRVDVVREAKAILARAVEADAATAEINTLRAKRDVMVKSESDLAAEVGGLSVDIGVAAAAVESMRGDAAVAEQVVTAMNTYKALAAGLPAHTAAAERAGKAVQQLRLEAMAAVVPAAEDVAARRAARDALVTEAAGLNAGIAAAKNIEAVKVAAVATEAELRRIDAELAGLPVDIADKIKVVEEDFRILTEQVNLAKSGVCPTCKQKLPTAHECMPLDQSEPLLAGCMSQLKQLYTQRDRSTELLNRRSGVVATMEAQKKQIADAGYVADVAAIMGRLGAVTTQIAEAEAFLNGVAAAAKARADAEAKLHRAEVDLSAAQTAIATVEKAKIDPEHYANAVACCEEFARRKAKAESGKALVASQFARLEALRKELAAVAAQITAARVPVQLDPAEVEKARAVVVDAASIDEQWVAVNSAFSVAEAEQRTAAQEFSTIDVLKTQNEANKRKHELIADMKFLVGVKQFPMHVAGFYVQAINALWAQELGCVDAKFSAWQDETTLEFYATFHGTDQTRMLYQLSGGERQLASVGYQVVINKLFAAGVDFIAFDEPTTHVDAAYRPKLVQAFTRMLQRDDLKDLQIFVVDHSVEFANAISDPIVLTKEG